MPRTNRTTYFGRGAIIAIVIGGLLSLTTQELAADDGANAKPADGKAATKNTIRVPSRVAGVLVDEPSSIRVGDKVDKGQLLAVVDNALAVSHVGIAEAKLLVAKAELEAAQKIVEETKERYRGSERLYKGGEANKSAIAKEELRASQLLWDTKIAELKKFTELAKIAELELKQAQIRLHMHDIRSPVRGVVKEILRHPGEATGALETVLVIQTPEEK